MPNFSAVSINVNPQAPIVIQMAMNKMFSDMIKCVMNTGPFLPYFEVAISSEYISKGFTMNASPIKDLVSRRQIFVVLEIIFGSGIPF